MIRIILTVLCLVLAPASALAQGATQSPNLFWATPLSGSGNLGLRAIGAADISGIPGNLVSGSSPITGTCTNGQVLFNNSGVMGCMGGTGTVTSVAMSVPSFLTVSGSPITGSGTFVVTATSESQNKFLASPDGSSGAMTPRSITNNDLTSALASPPCIGCTAPGAVAATTLSTTGAETVVGAGNSSTIVATDSGTATSYITPGFAFKESESFTHSSALQHFGFQIIANKNAVGSTTTGSRTAFGAIQSGAGGTSSDYFTGGFEIAQPCNVDYGVTCNSFNLSGNFTGNNPYAYIPSGMTPTSVVGEEIDVLTLSPTLIRTGLRIVDTGSTHTGAVNDQMLLLSGYGVPFNIGIFFGDTSGTGWPFSSASTLMESEAGTVGNGIYLTNSTITNCAFCSYGFSVTGVGAVGAASLTLTPASGLHQGLLSTQAITGTASGGFAANNIIISSDNVAASGQSVIGLAINQTFGGSATQGARVALAAFLAQNAITDATNPGNGRNYVGVESSIFTTSGDGGTTGAPLGAYFAINSNANGDSGAVNMLEVTTEEADFGLMTGSTSQFLFGKSLVHNGNVHATLSSTEEAYLVMYNAGTIALNNGIIFGITLSTSDYPVATTGSLINSLVGTVAYGVNFLNVTCNTDCWASPGSSIDGIGNGHFNTLGVVLAGGVYWGTNSGSNGGQVLIDNVSTDMFFDNLEGGPWVFRTTGGTNEFQISATGVLSSAGTAGVTCTGVTATTVTVKGGVVTHC